MSTTFLLDLPTELIIKITSYLSDKDNVRLMTCNKFLYSLRGSVELSDIYQYTSYLQSIIAGYSVKAVHVCNAKGQNLYSNIRLLSLSMAGYFTKNIGYLTRLTEFRFDGVAIDLAFLPESIKILHLNCPVVENLEHLGVMINLTDLLFIHSNAYGHYHRILPVLPPNLTRLSIPDYSFVMQKENNITNLEITTTYLGIEHGHEYPPNLRSLKICRYFNNLSNLRSTHLLHLDAEFSNVNSSDLPQSIETLKVNNILPTGGFFPNLKYIRTTHFNTAACGIMPNIQEIIITRDFVDVNILPTCVRRLNVKTDKIIYKLPEMLERLSIDYLAPKMFDTKIFAGLKHLVWARIYMDGMWLDTTWPAEYDVDYERGNINYVTLSKKKYQSLG